MSAPAPGESVRYVQGNHTLVVRRAYCKGCDLCIEACPAGILALDAEDEIYVADIERCLFCGACAGRCPDFVFVIERGGDAAHGRPATAARGGWAAWRSGW